jgi:predicted ATPase/DNA-binding SARP family transcriptional activator
VVTVHLLGDLRVSTADAVIPVTSPALRRLLTRIAIASGATVSMGQLADAVWGDDPPDRAKESLQSQIHRLRRLVGPRLVESTAAGYRLDPTSATTDLQELASLAASAPEGDAFLGSVEAGVDLLSDPALPGFDDEPWAIPVIRRVAEERAVVGERIVGVLIGRGQPQHAVLAAEQLVASQPIRESSAIALIEALAAAGRIADAMRVATRFRAEHVERTGLSPSAKLAAAERSVLARDDPGDAPRSTLPVPATACIGRVDDVDAVSRLLGEARIVTLWGPGGIGKTRLAIEVGETLSASCAVVFAELSEVSHGDRVIQVVGVACSAGSDATIESLVSRLDQRATLLIIDTAEHVVPAVTRLVRALVSRTRSLRVLVTSRERLDVAGEVTFEVAPLMAAGPELFTRRALAARRGVRLDPELAAAICARLDGLPLAIELAAAQVAWRSVPSILCSLSAPIEALDGPSDHTVGSILSATIEWSWQLLSDDERSLLGRVSTFASEFRLDAASEVAEQPPSAVGRQLASLVRKAMVVVDGADRPEAGYRLLNIVRAFVVARQGSAADDARARSARSAVMGWASARLEEIATCTRAGHDDQGAALRRLHRTNLAGALDLAIAHGMTDAVMGCVPAVAEIGWGGVIGSADRVGELPGWERHPAAPWLWLLRAHDSFDVEVVRQAADVIEAAALPAHLCARVRSMAVQLAAMAGTDFDEDLARLREIAASDEDPRTAWARAYGEHWAFPIGDPRALEWARRAGGIARASGRPAMAAIADYLAMQLRVGPEHVEEYRRLLALFERYEMGRFAGFCHTALAYADFGLRPVANWLAQTRTAIGNGAGVVRHLGEHRAHLIAHHGSTMAAATIFGGLDRLRADGLDVMGYGTDADRSRIVAAHPEAYRRGGELGMAELAAFVIDSLASIAGEQ